MGAFFATATLAVSLSTVVDKPGTYCLAHSKSCVSLISGEGGALVIAFPHRKSSPKHALDVNGVAWLNSHQLIFSTSAIYGIPGIYRYDLRTQRESTIVPSRARDSAYPEGKDFFKLISVDGNEATFWYFDDIERVNQETLNMTARREHAPLKGRGRVKAEIPRS